MDRVSFRYKIDEMLVNKSGIYTKYVRDKIDKILDITKQEDIQLETVAFIMLEADEYTRIRIKMNNIKVEVLHYTPLVISSTAIRRCWDSHHLSDNGGNADLELIDRIGNKAKHTSVKNHINFTFDIQGITTKTLLALTRHDVGTEFSVQSTRYTTKKSVKNGKTGYTHTETPLVNEYLDAINDMIVDCVNKNLSNDDISMLLPQAWHYNLIATMSLGALQHFFKLRLKKDAHWDIRDLAKTMYDSLPNEVLYLFESNE